MDYITKLSKETDPSIYKYRLLNLINNWGRITLFTGIGVEDIERPPYNEVEAGDFNTYEACLEAALQKCFIFIK